MPLIVLLWQRRIGFLLLVLQPQHSVQNCPHVGLSRLVMFQPLVVLLQGHEGIEWKNEKDAGERQKLGCAMGWLRRKNTWQDDTGRHLHFSEQVKLRERWVENMTKNKLNNIYNHRIFTSVNWLTFAMVQSSHSLELESCLTISILENIGKKNNNKTMNTPCYSTAVKKENALRFDTD